MATNEKKNKTIAVFVSVGAHAALLILFLFLIAWRQPNPPDKYKLPGVEINLGFADEGSGEVQPTEQPGTKTPEPAEQTEQPTPQPEQKTEEEQPEDPVVSKEESPVIAKEQKKEPLKDKPAEKPVEAKSKDAKPAEEKKTEAMKPVESKQAKNVASEGDDKGRIGDKGNPEGKPDAKALYGQPGGGGGDGMSLSMAGWAWADRPKIPDLPDNEDGRVVFEIECDENGEIMPNIKTLERGLSPRAEQLLKEEIRKNSLVRTSGGAVPPRSRGTVVFVLKTR